MADNTVTVNFNADTSGLQSGVNQANDLLENVNSNSTAISDGISSVFNTLETASDTALKGILLGTQTWQQALSRSLASIIASYITSIAKIPLSWLEAELIMTSATEEGNAARLASDETANTASIGEKAEQAVSSILNDSKQVFGGIFAFLAPELGPAAAGPAAAGSTSVAALASGITYAENGAWNIPDNTFAYLHAGEMVIPSSFASNFRSGNGLGSGGDNYSITINAVDTQTGAQFLKNNAATIAQALSSQVRNFNKNVPVWKS